VKEKRYDEADTIQTRINYLKKASVERKKRDLSAVHANEMDSLEQTYRKEVDEFNEIWDKKFSDFEEESANWEEQLRGKHAKETEEFEANIEKKLVKPGGKQSKDLLQLKALEDALVKQERYKEAHHIKKKVDNKERDDSERFDREKNEKVLTVTENLKAKQALEYNALRQKIETQTEVLRKDKEHGFTNLLNKFKNKKFELELQQKKALFYAGNESAEKASKY
jgi:hypothetical protein